MQSITEKKCAKCKEVKSVFNFGADKKHSDGLSSYCRSCDTERARKWRIENPEKQKEVNDRYISKNKEKRNTQSAEWNKNNAERVAEKKKEYRQNNKVSIREKIKQWRKDNHDKNSAIKQNYRALKYAGGTIKKEDWINLLSKYENKCLKCGRSDVPMTLDHVIPLSKGGLNVIENAQPLCFSCNSSKGAKHIDYR